MTTFHTYTPTSATIRASGFDALLIVLGRRLVSAGERLALSHAQHSEAVMAHDERRRDIAAIHHSGLMP